MDAVMKVARQRLGVLQPAEKLGNMAENPVAKQRLYAKFQAIDAIPREIPRVGACNQSIWRPATPMV